MRTFRNSIFLGIILFSGTLSAGFYSEYNVQKGHSLEPTSIEIFELESDTVFVAPHKSPCEIYQPRNYIVLSGEHDPENGRDSTVKPLLDSNALNHLYARIDSLRRAGNVPSAQVAIILPDTTLYWNFGMAKAEEPVSDSTMFRAGSISKTFAGLAMLMLVERGLVRLEDPLVELAPELPIRNPWRMTHPVRLSHLLESGAGFVGFHPPSPGPTETDLSYFLENLPFRLDVQWRPGEYNSYHNLGPVITAYLIEKISGQQYEEFVQENLFDALGMADASFFASPTVMRRLAWPPRKNSEGGGAGALADSLVYEHIRGYWPSGGLSTSARELAAMVKMLLDRGTFKGRQLLTPESVQRFETPTSNLASREAGILLGHGINNWTSLFRGIRYHGHGGRTSGGETGFSGYANYYAYAPEPGTGFVFMSTMGPAAEQLHYPVMDAVLSYLHPEEPSPAEPATAEETGDVAGCYVLANPHHLSAPLYRWKITMRNGQVWINEKWILELTKLPGVFRIPVDEGARRNRPEDALVVFVKNDDGALVMQHLDHRWETAVRVPCHVDNRITSSAGVKSELVNQDSTQYKSKFINAGGIRLQYLDFGGNAMPLVFVHSEGWDAYTYADFAPRFTNTNRVFSVTRPGYGKSEAHPGDFAVAKHAESLVAFLDALGIERAIFAGNSSPITYLTYLAEHHPDRVAGVIYLAGLMPMWLTEVKSSDPTGAGAMVARARTSDSLALSRSRIIDLYRPEFLSGENPQINVPALAFANRSGLIGYERFSWPLALVGSPLMQNFYADLPPSPATDYLRRLSEDLEFRDESLAKIQDSTARVFFTHLANDPEQQDEIWRYQQETIRQALVEGQEKFRRAFGNQLRAVPLDVSVIYGYEYRDSPDLIEPHIRSFLKEIKEKEQRSPEISNNSFKDPIRSQDQDLDQKIRGRMEKLEIPGVSLAVMREGKILRKIAYGYANLEPEVAATPSTIFPYASMAKVFTGTVILQLVQEGRFSLEDSITKLLPNLPKAWSGVTVRQLLSNTSGLPDMHPDRSMENVGAAAKMSREEILATLINRKADFAPGESFAYNQTNYLLLGMLIEKVDGRNIQDYVEEELAKPQNLESLHYGSSRDSIPEKATWYTRFDFSSGTAQVDSFHTISSIYPPFLYPAAGLNGTPLDLAFFVDALASNQLLKDNYKREMWTAVELSDGNIFRFGDSIEGSGLGWWVNDNPQQPYVWMGGGSSGILRHYINESLTIVVLTNLMGSEPEKIADDVAEIYLKNKIKN